MFEKLESIAALDVDGVFADTHLGRVQARNLEMPASIRLQQFEASIGEEISEHLNIYSLHTVSENAVMLLVDLAKTTGVRFVLASSWIKTEHTYKYVNKLFQYITGCTEDYVIAQSGGGAGREQKFMDWIKINGLHDRNIFAIDDTKKHFPKLNARRSLVAVNGRNGFTVDNYIKAVLLTRANSHEWKTWYEKLGRKFVKFNLPSEEERELLLKELENFNEEVL